MNKYLKKYLKYKIKYLNLKQNGGTYNKKELEVTQNINTLIYKYLNELKKQDKFILVDWMEPNINNIKWSFLSYNENAHDFITNEYNQKPNNEKLKEFMLFRIAKNSKYHEFLKKIINDKKDKLKIQNNSLFWSSLCFNSHESIIEIIKNIYNEDNNSNKIYYNNLAQNKHPDAILIIEDAYDKGSLQIDDSLISNLSSNTNPASIRFLKKIKQFKHCMLLKNSSDEAIEYIIYIYNGLNNIPNDYKMYLNKNSNPKIIKYLKDNIDRLKLLWYIEDNPLSAFNSSSLVNRGKINLHDLKDIPNIKANHLMDYIYELVESNTINFNDFNISWFSILKNKYSIQIIKKYKNNIIWDHLALNPNDEAIKLIEDEIEKHPENIDYNVWINLALNPNAKAIKLIERELEKHPENIDNKAWDQLYKNPAAIKLLQDKFEFIDQQKVLQNPAIFEKKQMDTEKKLDYLVSLALLKNK